MHAALIAEMLDIKEVIVPANPGVFSAWGMLHADIRHDTGRTRVCLLSSLNEEEFHKNFAELKQELDEVLEKEGIIDDERKYICALDMRYFGQEYTISVDIPDESVFDKDEIEKFLGSIPRFTVSSRMASAILWLAISQTPSAAVTASRPNCLPYSSNTSRVFCVSISILPPRKCLADICPSTRLASVSAGLSPPLP